MMTFAPSIDKCPEYLNGDERFVMNIFINGRRGGLGPFTAEKISHYAEMDIAEAAKVIDILASKGLLLRNIEGS